jgi:hypothetical protein
MAHSFTRTPTWAAPVEGLAAGWLEVGAGEIDILIVVGPVIVKVGCTVPLEVEVRSGTVALNVEVGGTGVAGVDA